MGDNDSLCVTTGDTSQLDESSADYVWFQIRRRTAFLSFSLKKLNENPSVGVVLCASKDDAVVEYALSRSMSPTLVSDYKLCLPNKEALQAKLREVTDIALEQADK